MRWIALFLIGALCVQGFADDVHKMLATGTSTVHKAPDRVIFKIGLITQERTVEAAVASNQVKMQRVIEAIKAAGLTDKEIKTGSYSISPRYAPPPKEPAPDWHDEIIGYEVRNTLKIDTSRLDLVGQLIDKASQAGANIVEDIQFSLENEESAKTEAIALAIRQAKVYADAAAKEAGIRLGEILELNINSASVRPLFFNAERMTLAAKAASTPIIPGDVDISSTVSIVFIIRN